MKSYLIAALALTTQLHAEPTPANSPAFIVYGSTVSLEEVAKKDKAAFYQLEKQKYDKVESFAKEAYLDAFWEKERKRVKAATKEEASEKYLSSRVKVSDSEVKSTLKQFEGHPQLSKLKKEEKEGQIREYLKGREMREVLENIISAATKNGELKILYPAPNEPEFPQVIVSEDPVRYGPAASDTKPSQCSGDNCAITVVEYSEFQCPFCAKVIPDTKKILSEYKGKIRWIVRDFPLSFHDRARPAAIAAKCAAAEGKYWEMYEKLFQNQKNLADAELEKYATEIGIPKEKFASCVKNPGKIADLIDSNIAKGSNDGVTGTPAFFINEKLISGAVPYSELKAAIDKELAKKKAVKS